MSASDYYIIQFVAEVNPFCTKPMKGNNSSAFGFSVTDLQLRKEYMRYVKKL